MLIVMALVLAMFLLCSAVLAMGTNTAKIAAFEVNQEKAYYIAEAGVEKVLAEAKNGPPWLKNLKVSDRNDEIYDFLANNLGGKNFYGEGTFEDIRIKKIFEDVRRVTLDIECRGKCGNCIKRIKTEAELEYVYPENLFAGLMVTDASSAGSNVFNLAADSYFFSDVVIRDGSHIAGDVFCRGLVCLQCEDGGAIEINGDIYALGGVDFTGAGLLSINGSVYVDDISKTPEELKGITKILPAKDLIAKIPVKDGFPALLSAAKLAWYQKNAGYFRLPEADGDAMVFQNGIYFVSGNRELSGTYSGNALLIIDGSVTLGNLIRSGDSDSLAILATGPICSGAENGEIDALLYSGGQVNFNSGATVKGSVLATALTGPDSSLSALYDQDIFNSFRDNSSWTTCFVRITRWNE